MSDSIVVLLVECNSLHVVKHTQQVCLDSVGIRRLSQNLKQGWVGHKEEPREDESLLLEVAGEGLLAEFKLLQQVR